MDSWKLYSASAMFTHRTNYMRDHTFSKYAKFFEKLLFFTRWYVHVTLKKGSLRNAYTRRNYFLKLLLRKKCPYSDFFLRRIFPHLDWIRHEIKKNKYKKEARFFGFCLCLQPENENILAGAYSEPLKNLRWRFLQK